MLVVKLLVVEKCGKGNVDGDGSDKNGKSNG